MLPIWAGKFFVKDQFEDLWRSVFQVNGALYPKFDIVIYPKPSLPGIVANEIGPEHLEQPHHHIPPERNPWCPYGIENDGRHGRQVTTGKPFAGGLLEMESLSFRLFLGKRPDQMKPQLI
jgi:hypothetical protein